MSTTRDVSTRLILQGEKEYRAAMQQISREYRVLESELKKVDSDFEGQRNTLAALEARHKALNDVIAQQSQRLKTEKDALENARKLQEDYARQAASARQALDELIRSTDDAAKGTEEYKDEVARLQSEIAKNETAETKCAQAVANHNPDYSIAQVEHGGTHGTISYAADRWRNGGATISYADGVLTAANAEEINYCYILQLLENRDIKGKRVTLAVEADGELLVYAATWPTEDNSSINSPFFSNGMRLRAAVSSLGVPAFILVLPQYDSTPVALKNARLYYGAYNVITLPPWKEPDLTIERSKCTDYLTRSSAAARYAGDGGDTTSKVRVYIPIGKRMRANPKVYPSSGISISVRVQTGAYNDTNATINNVTIDNFGLLLEITGSRQIINSPYANCTVIINTPLLFSSDL